MAVALHPRTRGRDRELAVLGEELARVRAGSGAVVLLEGPPGIGKSRLISEAVAIAGRLAIRTGTAAAEPAQGLAELAPLLRALFSGPEPLLDRAALGDLRTVPEQRYWLLEGVESLLERAAMDAPMLVCLDDLQWADAGTAAALRTLPARLASVPIGWILARRPSDGSTEMPDAFAQLEREGATRLTLEPLPRSAVAEVTAEVLQAAPDDGLLQMACDTGGSPFFLVELLLGLREDRLVDVGSGAARLVDRRLPDRVRRGMRGRLARLSESARQLAVVAASLGRTFSLAEVGTMLGQAPSALVIPLGQLLEADILREREDRLSFRHDLTREAVRLAAPVSLRRALDRQAADVLVSAGALPTEVAAQLAESAQPGDERAITILRQAADALGATDPGNAAGLSRRALELAPRGHPCVGALVAQTTLLLHAAGRVDEATEFADRYLRDVLPTDEEAAVRLGVASMFGLSPEVRVSAGRRALELANLSVADRARHLSRLVYNLVQAGRAPEAQALAAEARAAVEAGSDAGAAAVLTLGEGALLYVEGDFERALQVHEAAMRQGFGHGEGTRELVARQWRSELLAVLDRLDESMELISDGIAAARRDRQGWAVDFFEIWRGRQLLQRGRLSDAAATLEGRFDPDDGDRIVGSLYAAGLVALGRVAIHTGDERLTRETADIATAMLQRGTPSTRRHGAWLLALQAMADGAPSRARQALARAEPVGRAEPILPLYPMDVTDEPQLVRIALAGGDRELACATVAAAEERARRNPGIRSVQGAAAHARGLADDDAERLALASRLLDTGQRPLALASALEDLGGLQLRNGARAAGVEALGRALVLYTDAGAGWDARRVRARLRLSGVRRRLVAAERPVQGWGSLTDSELAVVGLVADGLTNREAAERLFVSPHTVNSHLRHAFTKLGVNSRVELSRVVAERERQPGRSVSLGRASD
jgi:DNA-binding CsgD family transcriptional regulator